MSDSDLTQAIKSLQAEVFSSDILQTTLSSLVRDHIDGLGHHLNSLTEAVKKSNCDKTRELEFQVALVSSHIENSFRGLAQEIASTFCNATSGDAEENTPNNQVLESASQLVEARVELKSKDEEIQRLKAALALAECQGTDDIERWKKSVEELQKSTRTQDEIISTQDAQLAKYEEDARLFITRYRNLVEELATAKGNIRVMVRIRPAEGATGEDLIKFTNPDNPNNGNSTLPWTNMRVTYLDESGRTENRDFGFQRAFAGGESNETVFNEVKDFAQSAALGNSSTIMAYGATGTGKSYTFLSNDGLVHSFITLLFRLADEDSVFDLLQTPVGDQKVEVKLAAESVIKLSSQQEAFEVIKQAIDRREAASTRQNNTSSRSHFVISVRIVRRSVLDGNETTGTASFVDLAGSEAAGKNLLSGPASPQQALQYDQGQDINKGLLDLGKNIRSVATGGTLRWTTEAIGPVGGRHLAPKTSERSSSRGSKLPASSEVKRSPSAASAASSKIATPSRPKPSSTGQGKSKP
ncbi:P-loop containing nucleoside triphosphate hydrolase protein [Ustulina deusta]|nr:P-loop containing nucleoside triphosphate hydrolase protein [Ustulina deusta]